MYLTIVDQQFLQGQGNARTLRVVSTPAYRGIITDRNGQPLAISTPVTSVWVDPQMFSATELQFLQLAKLLSYRPIELAKLIKQAGQREFLYLRRGLNPQLAASVKQMAIQGVYLQKEFRRFYPDGEVTAHLLGLTDVDDNGQEGLELAFNDWLQGTPGKRRVLKDRLGHIISEVSRISEPKPGHDLALSIDRRIQYVAYRELVEQVKRYNAKSGSVVVLDVQSGEVLAMANVPSYNPNNRPKHHDGRYRNRAVTDLFEPGSVIKPFSIASALVSGKYSAHTPIDTSPGWFSLNGNLIQDIRNHGKMDVTGVLKYSSNVGVSRMVLSLPPENLWNLLRKVGFGERTSSGFPGERSGSLEQHRRWRPFVLATLAFGYGIAVTPLQLADAYTLFARHGRKLPVTFLKVQNKPEGKQVLNQSVADAVLMMLQHVVEDEDGTGKNARIPNYHVAGKTGTARLLGPQGYLKDHHIASFVGIAPATEPRLVIAVVITDPRKKAYYGGLIAAPVFKHIMAESLKILNIPPDNLA
ncbi:MAG: penicillin-binding protein 2 [Gammaproteobacteria bacterium]